LRSNLTTLAPDIVDAILLNELPDHLTLFDLASDTPLSWDAQRDLLNLPLVKVRPRLFLSSRAIAIR
jgi:hypothetical protein